MGTLIPMGPALVELSTGDIGSMAYNMQVAFSATVVGKENMEIITKEGKKIERYKPSEDQNATGKKGKKVDVAYELENGEIIYVPE